MNSYKDYLGDGVYVEFDGYDWILTTENGVETTNRIVLEQGTYLALAKFIERVATDALMVDKTK